MISGTFDRTALSGGTHKKMIVLGLVPPSDEAAEMFMAYFFHPSSREVIIAVGSSFDRAALLSVCVSIQSQ